jgi:hypothetical protein
MAVLGRTGAVAVAFVVAAGCEPEILSGVYYCGPELACPPEQVCSPGDGTCVQPGFARPFECPDGTNDLEPDNDAASAATVQTGTCPSANVVRTGCLPAASDVDWTTVVSPLSCAGRNLAVDVRYPAAFAPVVLERMQTDGTVAETAPICDITGGIGANDAVCLRLPVPADGVTVVRLAFDPGLDCDDACDFTHYEMTVRIE